MSQILFLSLYLNAYPYISHILMIIVFIYAALTIKRIEKKLIVSIFLLYVPFIYTLIVASISISYHIDILALMKNFFILFYFPFLAVYLILEKIGINQFLQKYYKFIYICSLFGIIQFLSGMFKFEYIYDLRYLGLQITNVDFVNDTFLRVYSIFREPSILPIYFTPITLLILNKFINKEDIVMTSFYKNIIIIISLFLTFSVVAYVNFIICLIVVLLKNGLNLKKIIAVVLFIPMIILMLNVSIIENKINGLINNDSHSSGSSFAVISNLNIVNEKLSNSLLIGPGFYNYNLVYDKYINIAVDSLYMGLELNKDDASNLYLRLLGEYGILSLIFIFSLLLLKVFKCKGKYTWLFLSSFLIYGLRYGSYSEIILFIYLSGLIYDTKEKGIISNS